MNESKVFTAADMAHYQQKIDLLERKLTACEQASLSSKPADKDRIAEVLSGGNYINFISNLSHELLTPMNAISGLVGLGLEMDASPKLKAYLQQVQVSCHQLTEIIDELLIMASLAKGDYRQQQEIIRPAELVKSVVADFRQRLTEKNLELIVTIDPRLENSVVADAYAIRVLLSNLFNNALKFTHTGKITVIVAQTLSPSGNIQLKLGVEDTGVGIAADRQQRIFEPFFQADDSSTRRYRGIGLGLAICQQLVRLMGGSIVLESQQGEGTSVFITIAVKTCSQAAGTAASDMKPVSVEPVQETLQGLPDTAQGSAFREALSRLHSAAEEGDHQHATLAFNRITETMSSQIKETELKVLQQHLDSFDFGHVLACIGSIVDRLE